MAVTTPSRLSVIALGTLAALVAQELAQTASVSPSTITSTPESGKRDPSRSAEASNPKLTKPIAQPETVSPQKLAGKPHTQKRVAAKPMNQVAARPAPAKLTVEPVPNAGLLPIPPSPLVTQRQTVNVNQLPIDQFVAASLGQSATQVATATTSSPPQKVTVKAQTKRVAMQPQATPTVSQAGALSDIHSHPAQAAIQALASRGVIQGLPDGTYRPDAPVTDAEFNLLMQKAFGRSSAAIADIKRPTDVVTRADAAEFVHRQMLRAEAIAQRDHASGNELQRQIGCGNFPTRNGSNGNRRR
ncbi:S-layer homology domain-containing protein [Kovacikia minuta CCNUW1]|uniref:S-layer homology domain-containing protein n=1 Tax=Kovacikia minuta TaxID=2931930 RepID=UPI001CCA1F9B|nr:S-layer homology domain-containing protein [Kovacikia minuta]UBF25415.1 S-layer homology domain-containing protein [Kovacikia minuta CCNUW1]